MANKPFVAARIPEDLNVALDQFVSESGKKRTDVIISALREYLKSPSDLSQIKTDEKRLDALEIKVARLEIQFAEQNRESSSVIKPDKKSDNTSTACPETMNLFEQSEIQEDKLEGSVENQKTQSTAEAEEIKQPETKEKEANVSEEKLLIHRELSELIGWKLERVRSRGKKGQAIEDGVQVYIPVPTEKGPRWKLKTFDNN